MYYKIKIYIYIHNLRGGGGLISSESKKKGIKVKSKWQSIILETALFLILFQSAPNSHYQKPLWLAHAFLPQSRNK